MQVRVIIVDHLLQYIVLYLCMGWSCRSAGIYDLEDALTNRALRRRKPSRDWHKGLWNREASIDTLLAVSEKNNRRAMVGFQLQGATVMLYPLENNLSAMFCRSNADHLVMDFVWR